MVSLNIDKSVPLKAAALGVFKAKRIGAIESKPKFKESTDKLKPQDVDAASVKIVSKSSAPPSERVASSKRIMSALLKTTQGTKTVKVEKQSVDTNIKTKTYLRPSNILKAIKVAKANVGRKVGTKVAVKKEVKGKKAAAGKKAKKSQKGQGAVKGKGKGTKGKPAKVKKEPRLWTKEQKLAAALKRQSRVEGSKDRMYRSVDDWAGNSDSEGSVDSGALEENVCFHCGHLTDDDLNDELIICDRCASEIHLSCLGLEIVPRKGFICPRCKDDECAFEGLKYDVFKPDIYKLGKNNITRESQFPIPKRPKSAAKAEFCYSPSRPLAEAWSECLDKGFMSVSKVFDYHTMRTLTHGAVSQNTKSGRKAETWGGALREIENNIGGNAVHNLIDRNGRYDMRIPDFVIEQLGLMEKLQPILDRLKSIMGTPTPQIRTQNIVFAPVGSAAQEWHIDDAKCKAHRYFTILIHLNPLDEKCGGTELYCKKVMKGDMVRNRPGDAFIFNGSLLHRGQSNDGETHRLFYYASFACRVDQNVAI